MKKISLFFALLVIGLSSTFAQGEPITKSNYALAERFSSAKMRKMIYSTAVQPNWLKDGNSFWYTYKTSEGVTYYLVDALKKKQQPLFDHVKMAADLSVATGDPLLSTMLPLTGIKFEDDGASFRFQIQSKKEVDKKLTKQEKKKEEEKKAKLESEGKEYKEPKAKKENKKFTFQYYLATGKLIELEDYEPEDKYPSWASVSPDGQTAVFSKNFNLYYLDRENLEKAMFDAKDTTIVEHQITTDGVDGFAFGKGLDRMSEKEIEEFPTKRYSPGIRWSPDSKHFAMIVADARKVKKLWVINSIGSPRPTLESYRYQMAGEKDGYIYHLYLFDNETKESKEINVSEYKDQSMSLLSKYNNPTESIYSFYTPSIWLGNDEYFCLSRTSRDHQRQDNIRIDIASGEITELSKTEMNISLEERALRTIDNGKRQIVRSERDGWAHYYLYDDKGNIINQITKGEYHAENIKGIDEKNEVLYFDACGVVKGQNPYYKHLCSVNFDGTGLKVLNEGDFHFESRVNDNNTFFVSNFSRVDTAPKSVLYNSKGKKILDLQTADLSALMESGYKFPERFTVKAADGVTDLYGVMYKPYDFDSTKVYPIIEYVYPGPQTEAVNESFAPVSSRTDQLAQLGFIVITVGNRGGHSVRSKWYHTYGYNNLRDYGLADKKRAAEQLAARHSFIDINKVGIHGHSGGGFMSTAAMLIYPDFFKVAVSSAGNHDNNIYNRWWGEKHNGVSEKVSEKGDTTFAFKVETNPAVAAKLKGKLLLFHGEVDNNVHPANTMRVVNALIKANKRFDMILLPTQQHGFSNMSDYWFWRTADYFCEHLIGESKRDETHIKELSE